MHALLIGVLSIISLIGIGLVVASCEKKYILYRIKTFFGR